MGVKFHFFNFTQSAVFRHEEVFTHSFFSPVIFDLKELDSFNLRVHLHTQVHYRVFIILNDLKST